MATTLQILVTARDEATATLNKVAASGKKVGTSLSTAGTAGTASLEKANKGTNILTSSLGKLAKAFGIAFAIGEVIRFGKASIEAFEAVKREQDLVALGFQHIGQAAQVPEAQAALNDVSDATVTLQADTDRVAAAVLNVGHNYFQQLGPQAGQVLAGITKGLLNISAATHKSLGMMQRTLTQSLLNTPAKAITMLTKLGVATQDQAARWTDLANSGDLVTLQQEEINAVTNAYPNSASKAATASDRWKKAVNDLEIGIGALLQPLVNVAAKVAEWAAHNKTLIFSLIGAGGVLYAVKKVTQLVRAISAGSGAFGALKTVFTGVRIWAAGAAGSGGLAGFGSALVGLAGPLAIAGAGIAALAGVGVGLRHVLGQDGDSVQDVAYKLQGLQARFDSGGLSADTFAKAVAFSADNIGGAKISTQDFSNLLTQKLIPAYKDGAISQDTWNAVMRAGAKVGVNVTAVMQEQAAQSKKTGAAATAAGDATAAAANHAKRAVHVFAGMGKKDFRAWANDARKSAHEALTALGGVELATKHTAKSFLHDSKTMAKAAAQDAAAIRRLGSQSQNWVPDAYKKWLIDQGPQAVANFERLTGNAQRQAVTDWRKAQSGSDAYARSIEKLGNTGPIDAANSHLQTLSNTLERIAQQSPAYIDVYIRTHGSFPTSPPPHALGTAQRMPHYAGGSGYISSPELALVGEQGSEIVELPAGAKVWPHGTMPPAPGLHTGASPALARAAAKVDVHVDLVIDRRRFAREQDHEVKYRGW